MHDEIMTVAEVAEYLKMKPQTIYKWLQEGTIPAAKLGKEWRFKKSVIDEWIDRKIAESPAMEKQAE
jgi:PTS system nitrogen regulatory IIA component